ncbi:MAG: 6-pyruvoyl-tetrahydropterin synthase-related protein, partial [Anaerolineae bacterium]|nr:6-pyruvoyl-tetrahydropterin synthase-related protein [Anaerolineae bacterium]
MTSEARQAGAGPWHLVLKPSDHSKFWLLFPLLCGLLAAAPLWGPGIVATRGGGDSPFLLQRTLDMAESLHAGVFPVRWMAHAAYDLGYPFFNYYAALPYYLSGALTALGLNVLSAIQATQTLGFILAAAAVGLWTRSMFRSLAARILTVAAYTFAPFHLVNVYVRGDSLSEFYAFVWFPLILWALDRLAAQRTWSRVLTAACAYGALILTHNISALVFSPFALAYALVLTALPTAGSTPRVARW